MRYDITATRKCSGTLYQRRHPVNHASDLSRLLHEESLLGEDFLLWRGNEEQRRKAEKGLTDETESKITPKEWNTYCLSSEWEQHMHA
jgi:hypothetical protein